MSITNNHYVKNNLKVDGAVSIANSIDTISSELMQLGYGNATKLELARTTVITEMKGPTYALEGLAVTGATTISTTLVIGQVTPPSSDAIFEVESTTKGLLFPRMTTLQRTAIATPSAGLVVYDTTEGALFYRSDVSWCMLTKNKVDNSNLILGGGGSGNLITTGAEFNVIVGRGAALNLTTSDYNTIVGDGCLSIGDVGNYNTCIGANIGVSSVGFTGVSNVVLGELSCNNMTSGGSNTVIGRRSANTLTTGSNNVILGSLADGSATLSNQIALGYQATTTKVNQCVIGNRFLEECVPDSDATTNLGTETNPWNNIYLKGSVINTNNSGVIIRTEVSTPAYTLLYSDVLISSKYSAIGSQTLTLPLVSSVDVGKIYHIVDAGANAQTNNITIQTSGSDTINDELELLINLNYQSISIFSDGDGKWFVY
jgi:hypothetical protein